jgi:hypothetical protein
MKACANNKPEAFTFEKYPRGGYILWLRENFHQIESNEKDTPSSWIYDEYTILTPQYLTNSFIQQHFNEYLENARKEEASNPVERLNSAEDAIQDILEILADITG